MSVCRCCGNRPASPWGGNTCRRCNQRYAEEMAEIDKMFPEEDNDCGGGPWAFFGFFGLLALWVGIIYGISKLIGFLFGLMFGG